MARQPRDYSREYAGRNRLAVAQGFPSYNIKRRYLAKFGAKASSDRGKILIKRWTDEPQVRDSFYYEHDRRISHGGPWPPRGRQYDWWWGQALEPGQGRANMLDFFVSDIIADHPELEHWVIWRIAYASPA